MYTRMKVVYNNYCYLTQVVERCNKLPQEKEPLKKLARPGYARVADHNVREFFRRIKITRTFQMLNITLWIPRLLTNEKENMVRPYHCST